jgi:predicted transcriptional regulator
MEGFSVASLKHNSVIEQSLRRMRQMGLVVNVQEEQGGKCYIFITLSSVTKLIERQVKYPNKKVNIEQGFIVVELWKA